MNIFSSFCVFLVFRINVVFGISSSVPKHLVQCYRSNYTNLYLNPPLTVRLLIELIQKIEWASHDALNLQLFTTSLLQGVRFDGIIATPGIPEGPHLIPYSGTGKQFYKYKLIVDYLSSEKSHFIPYGSVSTNELCLLHKIISNTVHVLKHGNEGQTCSAYLNLQQRAENECPIESGVVITKWGTISPGHLVAGISAALQDSQLSNFQISEAIKDEFNVTLNNDLENLRNISNVWVSTIVGDLAEVALYQAFKVPKIGTSGIWNDTTLPRQLFLENLSFEMTSAELLGGIDGVLFAKSIKQWLSVLSRTRFSQLLDMYYSQRGVAYDKTYKACQREKKFKQLYKEANLTQQTASVAKLLQDLGATNQYLDESGLEKYIKLVVEEFLNVAEIEMQKYSDCEQEIALVQPLEIICILDEFYTGYKAERFIGELLEAIDLGFYSSSLGIIDGDSGKWLTNVTYSAVQLYEDLSSVKSWQSSLKLNKSLETVLMYLEKKKRYDCKVTKQVPRTTVILVMAHSARLSEDDLLASQNAINSIKNSYPDTRIMYVTSIDNAATFEILTRTWLIMEEAVVNSFDRNARVIDKIVEKLSSLPTAIVDFYCDNSSVLFEDYVTPDVPKLYEIHSAYLQRAYFSVQFKGNDYGDGSICIFASNSQENKKCQGLQGNNEVQFDANGYCLTSYNCSTQFSVSITNSKFKCAEFDCRYPDQMRVNILTSWTGKSGSSVICYNVYMVLLILTKSIQLMLNL